jgi:hypothetical protein
VSKAGDANEQKQTLSDGLQTGGNTSKEQTEPISILCALQQCLEREPNETENRIIILDVF